MNVLLKEDRREIYDVHIFPPIFTRTNNDSGTNNEIIKSKSRVNRSTKDTSLHRESSGNKPCSDINSGSRAGSFGKL